MAIYGHPREPGEIVDRLLWKDAQLMLSRHIIARDEAVCGWCRRAWPCPPRLLAEQAEVAAYEPRSTRGVPDCWSHRTASPATAARTTRQLCPVLRAAIRVEDGFIVLVFVGVDFVVSAGRARRRRETSGRRTAAWCASIATVSWWKRGVNAGLIALIVAGTTVLYSPTPAEADAAPTVTVVGSATCSDSVVGYLSVNFTVYQTSGPGGRFVSLKGSPLSTVNGPQNALTSTTPAVFRVLATAPDAALVKFTDSFSVTVAFDLPGGTVNVDASATITLPKCPAAIPPDADTYVQHCDRSVDAYVVYDPTFTAGSTTFTFTGRGYTGVAPYEPVSVVVTVSPGQTAHAFFPANHAYAIQLSQENLHTQFGDSQLFSGVPQGCSFFPPPGSPGGQSSTPATSAPQSPIATLSGQVANPVSAGNPGGSTTGGSAAAGTQLTPGSPGASVVADGVSADPTVNGAAQLTPRRVSAATTRSPAVAWAGVIGVALVVLLAGVIVVIVIRRRRT